MKRNKLITVSLGLILAGAGVTGGLSMIDLDPQYTPRTAKTAREANGAAAYLQAIRANVQTGEIDINLVQKAREQALALSKTERDADAVWLNWEEMGPDNVGGRTRSILIDKTNTQKMFAGSVGGGLFMSDNGGGSWAPCPLFDRLAIGCITQTADNKILVGTGEGLNMGGGTSGSTPGFEGMGIYVSSDGGTTFSKLASTYDADPSTWKYVNQLDADSTNPNRIYAATMRGLRISDDGGASWRNPIYTVTGTGNKIYNTNPATDVEVEDGVIVASVGNRAYVSTDGSDGSFALVSGSGATQISTDVGRLEFAIAPSNSNYIYCSAVTGSGVLKNIYASVDKGANWYVIGRGGFDSFEPFVSAAGQGIYDNAIAVDPFDAKHVVLGGVQLWSYKMVGTNPPSGGWSRIADEFEYPGSTTYVHADKHFILFHPKTKNTFYVGCDGGVFRTVDGGETFGEINRRYNVTQFYGFAFASNGMVLGGTQDNGSQLITFTGNTPKSAIEVTGGDGGDCAFSRLRPVAFTTIYNGACYRFMEGTTASGEFKNAEMNALGASFVTPIAIWESDTAKVYKEESSLFAIGFSGNVYITRQALDFSKTPTWFKVFNTGVFSSSVSTMAFSKDGNHLYFGLESGGHVYRVSNLKMAMDTSTGDVRGSNYLLTTQKIFTVPTGQYITDVAIDPNDADNVIVTAGNYGENNYIYRSTNATSSTVNPQFTSIQTNLPQAPVYTAVIESHNTSRVIVGTEYGVFTTDNAFGADPAAVNWYSNNANMGNVPVFMMRQNTMTYGQSAYSGVLYAASHGRGIWKTHTLVSGLDKKTVSSVKTNIYPNPAKENATVSFNLEKASKVKIKVYSLSGKEVINEEIQRSSGAQTYNMNLSNLSPGTYMVKIEGGGLNETRKIVKTE